MKWLLVMFAALLSLGGFAFAAPWDFLRMPIEVANIVDPIVTWIVLLVSLALMAIAALAYKKSRSPKLAWVLAAFALFFVKRLLNLLDLYVSPGVFMNVAIQSVFDFLVMACLFAALFRK